MVCDAPIFVNGVVLFANGVVLFANGVVLFENGVVLSVCAAPMSVCAAPILLCAILVCDAGVVLWNCGHWLNKQLTPKFVQEQTGKYLHRFEWLKYPEEQVGKLERIS